MANPPKSNFRFSTPIRTKDGITLATIDEALKFLEALPGDQVTVSLYYAHSVLKEAQEKGGSSRVEKARSELARALRSAGML